MKRVVLLAVALMLSACGGTSEEQSDPNAFSLRAQKAFKVDKRRTTSGVDMRNNDPVIYYIKDDVFKGLMITIINPLGTEKKSRGYIAAKEICQTMNYGGFPVWRLPSEPELKNLRENDFVFVGDGDKPLIREASNLWVDQAINPEFDEDDDTIARINLKFYKMNYRLEDGGGVRFDKFTIDEDTKEKRDEEIARFQQDYDPAAPTKDYICVR